MLSTSNEADTSERPITWETGATVSCGSKAGTGLEGEAGLLLPCDMLTITSGAVLTPTLSTNKIKFKYCSEVLVPGCRGNYVPLGDKPTYSHSHPHGITGR